jgi:hypothetical protein
MFSQIGRAVGLGGAASGVITLISALGLAAYWAASTQHAFGWFVTVVVTVVAPAALVGAVLGGAIFALVHVVASVTPLGASRLRYAGLAGLVALLVTGAFVARNGVEGLNAAALLFPVVIIAAGLFVGGKMARV